MIPGTKNNQTIKQKVLTGFRNDVSDLIGVCIDQVV